MQDLEAWRERVRAAYAASELTHTGIAELAGEGLTRDKVLQALNGQTRNPDLLRLRLTAIERVLANQGSGASAVVTEAREPYGRPAWERRLMLAAAKSHRPWQCVRLLERLGGLSDAQQRGVWEFLHIENGGETDG